jgi:hypothetical protein
MPVRVAMESGKLGSRMEASSKVLPNSGNPDSDNRLGERHRNGWHSTFFGV